MKKKIIFFTPSTVGGAERMTLTYAKILDPNIYEIKIVVVGRSMGDIEKFIPNNIPKRLIYIYNIWDFVTLKILFLLIREKPDYVFCSLMYLSLRLICATRFLRHIKVFVRNNNGLSTLRKDNRFLIKYLYPNADKIILQTKEMYDEMYYELKIDRKRLLIIPNPIDVITINRNVEKTTNPFSDEYTNYVFVGRISHVKGIDVLIEAFGKIVIRFPQSRLYIVGAINESNGYYKDLRAQILRLKISDRVFFIGFTTNPHVYMKYASCFVLPSRLEGMPNVVLEAMYLKVPVVVTRSVPVIDSMVDKRHGIIVPKDNYSALAKAMIEVLSLHVTESYNNASNLIVKDIFNI